MDENIVAEEQVQQVALQSEPQTNEVVSQEVVASAVTVGVDVDKTLYDAEEFLANFAGLRLENDQLKRSNEELQQQLEKARHDLQQMQLEKSSLEAVLIKEREQHKEALWKVKSEFQKIQEERLQWKEKYLNICMRNGNTTEPIQPGRKRKLLTAENENEEFYTNLAATFGLAGQEEQPVAVIILKKKSGVSLPNGVTDESEMYSGERHEVESFSIGENQKLRETKSRLDNLKARSFTPEDVLQQQQIKTSELQKTKERIKNAFSHTKPSRAESDVSHRTQSPRMDNVKLSSDVETGYKRFFRIPGEPPTPEQTTEKDSEEYKVFVLEDDQSKELSSNPTSSNRENNPRDYSPVNFSTDISIKRHDKIQYSVEHHSSYATFPTHQTFSPNTRDNPSFIRPGVSINSSEKPTETNLYDSPMFHYNNRIISNFNKPQAKFRMAHPGVDELNLQSKYDIQHDHQQMKDPRKEFIELDRKFDFVTEKEKTCAKDMITASMVTPHEEKTNQSATNLPDSPQKKKVRLALNHQMAPKRKPKKATEKAATPRSMALTDDNPFSGPNKAAEEISTLVEIDKDIRAELTQEIKTLYWRIEEEKKYVCKLCEKTFERFSNLNAHVTMHLELKPYICKSCGSSYKLRSLLNDHIRIKHLKKSGYVNCQSCNGRFKLGSSYLKHRAFCTNVSNSSPTKEQDNPPNTSQNELKEETCLE